MYERYIKIVHRCERRRTGWTPAFHLCLIDARLVRILSQFSAANSRLIFTTRGGGRVAERAAGARLVQEELSGLASAVEGMMALDVARSYEPLATSEGAPAWSARELTVRTGTTKEGKKR